MPNRNAKQISVATPEVELQTETSLRDSAEAQHAAANPAQAPVDSKPRRVRAVGSSPAKMSENTVTVAPGATRGNTTRGA